MELKDSLKLPFAYTVIGILDRYFEQGLQPDPNWETESFNIKYIERFIESKPHLTNPPYNYSWAESVTLNIWNHLKSNRYHGGGGDYTYSVFMTLFARKHEFVEKLSDRSKRGLLYSLAQDQITYNKVHLAELELGARGVHYDRADQNAEIFQNRLQILENFQRDLLQRATPNTSPGKK